MKTCKLVDSTPSRRPVDKTPVGRLAALLARAAANDFVRQCDTHASSDTPGEVLTICTEFDGQLPPPANDIGGTMPSISCQPEPRGKRMLEGAYSLFIRGHAPAAATRRAKKMSRQSVL